MKSIPLNTLLPSLILFLVAFSVLFSYPFILKVFNPTAYQLGFFFLVALLPVAALLQRELELTVPIYSNQHQFWFWGFVIAYSSYTLVLVAISILNTNSPSDLQPLFSHSIKVLVALCLFAFIPISLYTWSLDRYVDLIGILSIMGLLMLALIFLDLLPVLSTVTIDTFGKDDRGVRQFYGLGFGWNTLRITDGIRLPRLQSFASEAGNFAFPLLVAMIWAGYRRRILILIPMLLALFLTWSVGAVITGAFVAFLFFLAGKFKFELRRKHLPYVLAATPLLLLALPFVALGAQEFSSQASSLATEVQNFFNGDYWSSKVSGSDSVTGKSSLGTRIIGVQTVWAAIVQDKWLGLGAGGLSIINVSLGVGWFRSLVEAGLMGWILYCFAFICLVFEATIALFRYNDERSALAGVMIILAMAAFQRAPMDASLWHWWLVIAFLKFSLWRNAATIESSVNETATANSSISPETTS